MWHVEVTDTFGGQANYSWVKRYELAEPAYDEHAKVKRYLVRAAKNSPAGRGIVVKPTIWATLSSYDRTVCVK